MHILIIATISTVFTLACFVDDGNTVVASNQYLL